MLKKVSIVAIAAILLIGWSGGVHAQAGQIAGGPLRVHPSNPRYFTDATGQAIYLTGSHIHTSLQDRSPDPGLDYIGYLNFMERHHHNFMRMWLWEGPLKAQMEFLPLAYKRSGSGTAWDGQPKFNLQEFHDPFFERMRARVIAARQRGIYVSIMLFQGWNIEEKQKGLNPWPGHPFHRGNNVNGIDGDPDRDNQGKETHTLLLPAILALQETFVRKVIDTVNDLDNVLYEISNEDPATPENTAWQYHMINHIRRCEKRKLKRHPVLMTYPGPPFQNNHKLFASPAEAISPGWGGNWGSPNDDYRSNPPAGDGRKVVIADTDHLWGLGGDFGWVWKSFLRGLNPIFMDPYLDRNYQDDPHKEEWPLIRKNMGYALAYAQKVNLAALLPRSDLSSTNYCLANPGREYLIYLPPVHQRRLKWSYRLGLHRWTGPAVKLAGWNEQAVVDLSASPGTYRVEWFNPRTGETRAGDPVQGGGQRSFRSPFLGDSVLYIHRP